MHGHPALVAVAIADGTYRFTSPGAEPMEIELKAGQAIYMDAVEHETEFLGPNEYTSFRWMKEHAAKFDGTTMTDVPVLEPGAMVRKGATGAARDDGMTEEISQHLRMVGSRICQEETAVEWLYNGGPLPPPDRP